MPASASPEPVGPGAPPLLRSAIIIGGALLLILVTYRWGRALQAERYRTFVNAPPLTGNIEPRLSWASAIPVGVAGVALALTPNWISKLRWRHLLIAGTAGALLWSIGLAATDGADGFLRSPTSSVDYLHTVSRVTDPLSFLRSFVDHLPALQGHAFSHPPGMVLLLWSLDRAGLGGPWGEAAVGHVAAALTVPVMLHLIRNVEGEGWARRATPFLAFAPAAVFYGSGADPLFMLLGITGVALMVKGLRDAPPAPKGLSMVASGVVLGTACFFSYGMILVVLAAIAVCLAQRRFDAATRVAVGVAAVAAGFALAGFWWLEGFLAARPLVLASVVRSRPYSYFVVANIAAILVVFGPAVWVALTRLRWRRWLLPGFGLALMFVADISGLSKGEVERIWLPFVPLVMAGTGVFEGRSLRLWLGPQLAWASLVQFVVRSPW
ncbi:MAG: hypothetical protein WD096_07640 [Actinomycetota bacterium]